MLTIERDQARKQYAELRKEFEKLKQAGAPGAPALPAKEDSAKFRKELEQQLEGFRQKLEEKNKEIADLKAGGAGLGDSAAKAEIASLREQLTKAKEEASVAQRGLALSQKALHETRDTLREATEGSSLSRHNFDNLKTECATLAQQNTVLQAQNDQLTRELAAAKSKLTTRL
jgi:chromosome segregation ATPase